VARFWAAYIDDKEHATMYNPVVDCSLFLLLMCVWYTPFVSIPKKCELVCL
jgi:hypothetical protein